MYGFLAGFSSPESIFAEKNIYFLFCNQNRKYLENFDLRSGMKLHARLKMLLTTKTRVVTISCNTCSGLRGVRIIFYMVGLKSKLFLKYVLVARAARSTFE